MVKVGNTLTANPAPVTGDPTPVRSWQWLRDNVTISGATDATYYVQAADEGSKISVQQIERNVAGVDTATSAQTATVGAYDPGTLFASGEVGAWYDPSDSATVWQDAAGTTPAGVGDPVGRIDDKSGNGNHATQTTSAARPVLQQSGDLYYLDFDGVDDSLSTAAIDMTATDQIDYGFGLRRDRINAAEIIAELGSSSSSLGHFYAALQVSSKLEYVAHGNVPASAAMLAVYSPVGASSFVSVSQNEIVPPLTSIRLNGSLVVSNTVSRGTGNFGNYPLYIGSRTNSSLRFDGAIYSYVMVNRTLTAGEITDLETYLAAKSGVTLP